MRNSLAVTPRCEVLVYYLDTRYDMSYNIVLGSAFLNSYYAQFEYNINTNVNTMTLTLS